MNTKSFPYKWWALIGLSLLSFTAFLDYFIVATSLPFIQKELNATVLQLQWVINIFSMILCMFMIISGLAGDILGRKKVFYFGFLLFAIAALGAGYSNSIQWLIFFRGIQAFAAAIILTIGVALLPQAFPANEQIRAIGIFSAFNGAGLAAGPFLGGLLITFLSWRWVFWINIPIIIVGILCCSFSLQSSPLPDSKIKIDWLGLFLLVVGLGCLIFGIVQGEQIGWDALSTDLPLLIGVVSLSLLMIVETRVAQPLLDLSIFKNTYACLAILICIIAGLITSVFMFFDPLFLKLIRHQTALMVGLTLLSVPIIQVAISLLLTKLVANFGIYNLIMAALASAVLAAICHALFTPASSIYFILLGLILMGYTWGIANAGSISAVHASTPPDKLGSAIGTIFTFWNLSSSVFLALSSVLFHWREKLMLNTMLNKMHLRLSPELQTQVDLLLSNPENQPTILTHFKSSIANDITQIFQTCFMSGFHFVAWCSVIIMMIAFCVSLSFRNKIH